MDQNSALQLLDEVRLELRNVQPDDPGIRERMQSVHEFVRTRYGATAAASFAAICKESAPPASRLKRLRDLIKSEHNRQRRRMQRSRWASHLIAHGVKHHIVGQQKALYCPDFQKDLLERYVRIFFADERRVELVDLEDYAAGQDVQVASDDERAKLVDDYLALLNFVYRGYRPSDADSGFRETWCWSCKRSLNSHMDPSCPSCSQGEFLGLICRCGACLCPRHVWTPDRRDDSAVIRRSGIDGLEDWWFGHYGTLLDFSPHEGHDWDDRF